MEQSNDDTAAWASIEDVSDSAARVDAQLGLVLAGQVAQSLKTPIEVATRADPVGLLRADRRTYFVSLVGSVIAISKVWLWAGGVFAVADGVLSAVGVLIVLLLGSTSGAWARYLDARLRLAMRGRLPWRTISFLNDAHRRGVLRQTGAVYQFRHIRLQEQLAAGYSPWPRPLEPVAAWTGKQLAQLQPFLPASVAKATNRAQGTEADFAGATEYTASGEVRAISPLRALGVILQVAIVMTLFLIAVFALEGWVVPLLILIAGTLLTITAMAVARLRARSLLPAGYWSIHVTPDAIELTLASRAIRLTADDMELIAVRPIGKAGSAAP